MSLSDEQAEAGTSMELDKQSLSTRSSPILELPNELFMTILDLVGLSGGGDRPAYHDARVAPSLVSKAFKASIDSHPAFWNSVVMHAPSYDSLDSETGELYKAHLKRVVERSRHGLTKLEILDGFLWNDISAKRTQTAVKTLADEGGLRSLVDFRFASGSDRDDLLKPADEARLFYPIFQSLLQSNCGASLTTFNLHVNSAHSFITTLVELSQHFPKLETLTIAVDYPEDSLGDSAFHPLMPHGFSDPKPDSQEPVKTMQPMTSLRTLVTRGYTFFDISDFTDNFFPSLVELEIAFLDCDSFVAQLASKPGLETLSLKSMDVDAHDMLLSMEDLPVVLASAATLKTLNLRGEYQTVLFPGLILTRAQEASMSFPSLVDACLSKSELTAEQLVLLADLAPNLKTLNLASSNVVPAPDSFPLFCELEELDLTVTGDHAYVTDSLVKSLVHAVPKLKSLNMSYNRLLRGGSVVALAKSRAPPPQQQEDAAPKKGRSRPWTCTSNPAFDPVIVEEESEDELEEDGATPTDRPVYGPPKEPTYTSFKLLNIIGCQSIREADVDALKQYIKPSALFANKPVTAFPRSSKRIHQAPQQPLVFDANGMLAGGGGGGNGVGANAPAPPIQRRRRAHSDSDSDSSDSEDDDNDVFFPYAPPQPVPAAAAVDPAVAAAAAAASDNELPHDEVDVVPSTQTLLDELDGVFDGLPLQAEG